MFLLFTKFTFYLIIKSVQKKRMNLSDINSVNDLIEANNKIETNESLVNQLTLPVYKEEPQIAMECAIDILMNLLGFHATMMDAYIEEGESKKATQWAVDVARIEEAISILKKVVL